MFHVIPDGILVFEIVWNGETLYFPADFNVEGDRGCHVETETEWVLNWTIDTRRAQSLPSVDEVFPRGTRDILDVSTASFDWD